MAFDEIVFFGDSLSDPGNLSRLVLDAGGDLLPPDPYSEGRFSNGPVFSEVLGDRLSVASVQNYANAGARAIGSRTLEDFAAGLGYTMPDSVAGYDLNLNAQVDRFLADNTGDLSGMAASILIGPNDLSNFDIPDNPLIAYFAIQGFVADLSDAIVDAGEVLANAGVGTIISYTLPPATFFPAILNVDPGRWDLANEIVADINAAVAQRFAARSVFDAVDVRIVDLALLADELAIDPEGFGFIADRLSFPLDTTDPQNPILESGGFDLDQFLFWDELHPTEAGHGIIGAFSDAYLNKIVEELSTEADTITTGFDGDLVIARDGDDSVVTRGGADVVLAGRGNDYMKLGQKADIAICGAGADYVVAGGGRDILSGGRGDDRIYGGGSADFLVGGRGNDLLRGDNGDDVFIYTETTLIGGTGDSTDIYRGGKGADTLYLALEAETFALLNESTSIRADLKTVLGLTVGSIETIVLLEGRGGLDDIAVSHGFGDAVAWNLI